MAKADEAHGLTDKQAAFVREYLKDSNGTQAAARAGYAESGAAVTASKLLKNPKVRQLLDQHTQVAESIAIVDKAWVLGKLRENVDRAMQAEPVCDREGGETGEFTYNGAVANKALELLGKDLGMFVQRVEVSAGEETVKTAFQIARDATAAKKKVRGGE